jgi:hypothetical protein
MHQTLQQLKHERRDQAMKNRPQKAVLTSSEEAVDRWASREVPTVIVFFRRLEA